MKIFLDINKLRVVKSIYREIVLKVDYKLFGYMVFIVIGRKLDMRLVLVYLFGLLLWLFGNCDCFLKKISKFILVWYFEKNVFLVEVIL